MSMVPTGLSEVYPGVFGAMFDEGERGMYVPIVIAKTPGNGDVGRFIDHILSEYHTVKFPCVLSVKLKGMLGRRGFRLTHEWDELGGEWVEVWVKKRRNEEEPRVEFAYREVGDENCENTSLD